MAEAAAPPPLRRTTATVIPPSELNLPRSKIYVTAESPLSPAAAQASSQRFKTAISDLHFILIVRCGELLSADEIRHCEGQHRCLNCSRPIVGPLYFIPERFNPQTNEPTCIPLPHCSTACVYRSIQDRPNNGDLLTNMFLMYGHDITCAPPRFMLYLPGPDRMTWEQYHAAAQDHRVYESMDPCVHPFLAPILLSCTVQQDHQLLPQVVQYIDGIKAVKRAAIGPRKPDGAPEQLVIPLPPKLLAETRSIADVFRPDPASFDRPGIAGNPHMGHPPPPPST